MGIYFHREIIFLPFPPPSHVPNDIQSAEFTQSLRLNFGRVFGNVINFLSADVLTPGFIQFQCVSIEGPFTSLLSFLLHFLRSPSRALHRIDQKELLIHYGCYGSCDAGGRRGLWRAWCI